MFEGIKTSYPLRTVYSRINRKLVNLIETDLDRSAALNRQLPCQQLIHHHAYRIEIAAVISPMLKDAFWRHIVWCARELHLLRRLCTRVCYPPLPSMMYDRVGRRYNTLTFSIRYFIFGLPFFVHELTCKRSRSYENAYPSVTTALCIRSPLLFGLGSGFVALVAGMWTRHAAFLQPNAGGAADDDSYTGAHALPLPAGRVKLRSSRPPPESIGGTRATLLGCRPRLSDF